MRRLDLVDSLDPHGRSLRNTSCVNKPTINSFRFKYTENLPLLTPLRVVAGQHNLAVDSGTEQIRETSNVIVHPDYTGGVAPYDIALLGAAIPLQFVAGVVASINLPQAGVIPSGDVRLFGWGSISQTDTAVIPDILQTVTKDLLTLDFCREVLDGQFPLGTPLHNTNVCTGPLNSVITACSGDSGGPIVQGAGATVS